MKTAVVICPGRGSYNREELGYLQRHFPQADLLDRFDTMRTADGQDSLTALDGAARFSLSRHGRGDNASALIYAASLGDFLSIDSEKTEVVAVTGNSMGWYTALACGGALPPQVGFRLANTMGQLMQEAMIGGQIIHPWIGENWEPDTSRRAALLAQVVEINAREGCTLALSIDLGGFLVLAGNEAGLGVFETLVEPVGDRYPMRLANHAAFHTALQVPVAERGRALLSVVTLRQPSLPLIDGRGAVWWPGATDIGSLWDYTLRAQVTETYDFTHAIKVAAREFAPDLFVLTGPGATLGGAVAQSLICADWRGMASKSDFRTVQGDAPLLASMGLPEQRALVA